MFEKFIITYFSIEYFSFGVMKQVRLAAVFVLSEACYLSKNICSMFLRNKGVTFFALNVLKDLLLLFIFKFDLFVKQLKQLKLYQLK